MLSEYEKARQRYEEGLVIYREIKARLGEANSLKSLGDVHRMLSEYEKARQRYEEGLVIYREIKARLGEANSLKSLGDMHRMLSEYEKARQRYEQGLALQQKIGDRHGIIWSSYRMGQVSESENDFQQAKAHYSSSIDVVEDVWQDMKLEEHKTSFLGTSIAPYQSMIALLFRNQEKTQAYEYAQRSKARSFLYLMGNDRIDPKKGVPLKLVRQEKELKRKIARQTHKIIENEKKAGNRRTPAQALAKELFRLKEKHREVLFFIKLNSPEYASLVAVDPLSLENIQALLKQDKDTLFIEYYTTDETTFVWAIDENDIKGYAIPVKRSDLYAKVEDFRTMLSKITFGTDSLAGPGEALYDLLLKPVENYIQGKRVIGIIPHGALHYLPFDALMKDGKFLTEQKFKLFYLPCASSYKYSREKNPLKKEQLIAFGDPDGSLPFSKKESEELKRLYPEDTEIFTRDQATESDAKDYAQYADILHFACHGGFNPYQPLYSSLSLKRDGNNDGNLEVAEIFQLELKPAYLVTLSACETYLGGIREGDEIVGMARAFMYAGTPSILASLWKVDDYYTQKLMAAFYRELKHCDKIEALYKARQVMIEKYGKRHPFYWAGFVLMGDYR